MLGKQALVMRARDITRSLEPSFFVPGVLKSFKVCMPAVGFLDPVAKLSGVSGRHTGIPEQVHNHLCAPPGVACICVA
jgi:hypothetical protein